MHRLRRRVLALMVVLGAVAAGLGLSAAAGPAGAATPAPTRTLVSTPDTSVVGGQVVHLKAVVKPVLGSGLPTGKVTFKDGSAVIGTAQLVLVSGVEVAKITTNALSAGTHTISAVYAGNTSWAASTSLSITVTVGNGTSTTTVVAVAVAAVPGKYNLNAKVKIDKPGTGTPTGYVTFVIDGGPGQAVGLDATGRAHLAVRFAVGTKHTVQVTYGGDSRVAGSSATTTFTA